jgi:hypothetical protein
LRVVRHILVVASIALLAWASVVDNAAVCPDGAGEQGPGSHRHDTPPSSHCCLGAPCHSPTLARVALLPSAPAAAIVPAVAIPARVLTGIDSPAPPTPPPTTAA